MKELVEYLVKSLAEHPEAVEITEEVLDDTVSMALKISQDDLGRIIGKGGNTINAIRTVVQAAASSHKKRAKLEVVSDAG